MLRFVVNNNQISTPVNLDISKNVHAGGLNDLALYKVLGDNLISIPFQVDTMGVRSIWFVSDTATSSQYVLKKKETENSVFNVEGVKKNGNLDLRFGDRSILTYRYGMKYAPEGVDSLYKKSGYIHPLLSPKGDTLTNIQPKDHYHHYGIWGPWTHTQINGEQVDFWNLRDGKGTVLFKEFKNSSSGEVFASFMAAQEHIDLLTETEPQIALKEDLKITLWNLNRSDRYMFDYKSVFSSPLQNGILFEAYRYGGGIGMRFTDRWNKDNCSVLTSSGNDRLTADGTNARWCMVSGESLDGSGTNGILFMSHPQNRMHPEPMRVWPIDANGGRGDMFFEFCPIRHEEWKIEPNKEYQLNYRMVVFEGQLSSKEAEAYWQVFANSPKVNIKTN